MADSSQTLIEHIEYNMVFVQGGKFRMGEGKEDDEEPHEVFLDDFYMSRYPVTIALWKAVMGESPAYFQGGARPVEQVSWGDCQRFLERLNLNGPHGYRLPSEAEWEYAARGGRYEPKALTMAYAGSHLVEEVAWWDENSHYESQYVGQKRPNPLGLYDMSGNIWEWCQDWYSDEYYDACKAEGLIHNPQGPDTGRGRVVRGGSWDYNYGSGFRVANRDFSRASLRDLARGFRLSRY